MREEVIVIIMKVIIYIFARADVCDNIMLSISPSKDIRSKCDLVKNTIELNNKTIHYLML